MGKKETEVYLGGGTNLNMKSSQLVTLNQTLTLIVPNSGGAHQLNIKIEADFDTIPEQYHEVFLNMLSAKYLSTVSYGDNPFSQCVPAPTKKWWQFWIKE
jgi:hypothetical protein